MSNPLKSHDIPQTPMDLTVLVPDELRGRFTRSAAEDLLSPDNYPGSTATSEVPLIDYHHLFAAPCGPNGPRRAHIHGLQHVINALEVAHHGDVFPFRASLRYSARGDLDGVEVVLAVGPAPTANRLVAPVRAMDLVPSDPSLAGFPMAVVVAQALLEAHASLDQSYSTIQEVEVVFPPRTEALGDKYVEVPREFSELSTHPVMISVTMWRFITDELIPMICMNTGLQKEDCTVYPGMNGVVVATRNQYWDVSVESDDTLHATGYTHTGADDDFMVPEELLEQYQGSDGLTVLPGQGADHD